MNAEDLTENGMRQGVKDSDVFLLFLTNSALSRTFCLREFAKGVYARRRVDGCGCVRLPWSSCRVLRPCVGLLCALLCLACCEVLTRLDNCTIVRRTEEIGWALEFDKPVIIVVEQEERFWAWDMSRWERDQCTRAHDGSWTAGWLQQKYSQCPANVCTMIKTQHDKGDMIAYRRREFEVEVRGWGRVGGMRGRRGREMRERERL